MPITLYENRDNPPCMSVMILAKMIGVELQLKEPSYEGFNTEPSFLKINPAHSVPALDDNGFHIWESGAIMGYLVQQYSKNDQLYPRDPKKRAKVDNMLHFDGGKRLCQFSRVPPIMFGHDGVSEAKDKVKDRLTVLNTILSEQPYVAGDSLSVADVAIQCSLLVPPAFGYGNYSEHPNIAKWIERFDREVSVANDFTLIGLKLIAEWVNESIEKFGLDPTIFHQK